MSDSFAVILGLTLYKLACLAVGALLNVLGYRLFLAGLKDPAGNLVTEMKGFRIELRSAAPGTFFAVLGAVIVIFTVWQGMNFNLQNGKSGATLTTEKTPALPENAPLLPTINGVSK